MDLEELKKKAGDLDIEIKDDVSEDDLKELISEKEEANAKLEEDKKDRNFYKAEFEKARDKRDAVKKDARKLRDDLKKLEDKLKDSPDTNEFNTLKEQIKELKAFKKEIDDKEEERKLKDKSELEKETIRFNKKIGEMKSDLESKIKETQDKLDKRDSTLVEKDKKIIELRFFRLENEISSAALKNGAYSPKQIVKLVKDVFTYDENLDKFSFFEKDNKGKIVDEKTVNEYVAEFLKDSDNENLVEASVNTEGSHTQRKTQTTKTNVSHKSSDKYDPKDPKLIKEAENKGLSVEDLIAIKNLRDEKMNKIKTARG